MKVRQYLLFFDTSDTFDTLILDDMLIISVFIWYSQTLTDYSKSGTGERSEGGKVDMERLFNFVLDFCKATFWNL